MKRNLTLIAILAIFTLSCLLFVACSKQESKVTQPEQPIANNPVVIAGNTMTIGNGSQKVTVTRQPTGYAANYGDFNVLYKDPEYIDGQVAVIGFREWTSDDDLDVRIEALGYRHQRETYTRNGVQLTLDINDQLTDEQRQQLLNFLADGEKNITNSVMDNADGYALASILEPNMDNIDASINSLDKQERPEWGDFLCDAATACIAAKCWAGGIANSVCGACTAVRFACAIMDMFNLWQ
jgi:hypothetical protein